MHDARMEARIREKNFSDEITCFSIDQVHDCDQAIRKADLVIGMVPDTVLLQVADSCIKHRKTLISPARLTRQMAEKKTQAKNNDALILMDCGFTPGLDHIIAKKAIDNIHSKGGKITSFKTYSGSFSTEASPDNPCGFKLMEPLGDLLNLGKHHNRHLLNGQLQHIPYHRLFERSESIQIRNLENMKAIPEGDSLYYRKIYDLTNAHTVVKNKLAPDGFVRLWDLLIKTGLTDNHLKIDLNGERSFYKLLESYLPYSESASLEQRLQHYLQAGMEEIEKFRWLGLLDTSWPESFEETTPAMVLQHLLLGKLSPHPDDKDLLVMEHRLEYEFRGDCYEFSATFISQGENQQDSALARAIGFTSGAACRAVLEGLIKTKGLHIPILKEIYDPILNELSDLGVAFHVEDRRVNVPHAAEG